MNTINFNINNTFTNELPADPIRSNERRQVEKACFSYVTPRVPSNPTLLHVSESMATSLGLQTQQVQSEEFLQIFSGQKVYSNTEPYAMCYGGHQFGHWAGQLGDGRAINLMEVIEQDQRWALQLKGAGETPYSRTADGFAVLRSSIREHLCSEAMYHLGVPTTRSLSLVLTGDEVLRDIMYDGRAAYEPGAIVCRVAPSFLRFGNFQIFASRGDTHNLKILMDYTIKHFFSHLKGEGKDLYVAFFNELVDRTLEMIVHWQRVGFVHGVMNTDNMSILGLTIDYGPYGWLEPYDKTWTPNTTDKAQRRYRFGSQPAIAQWNLFQLANALHLVIDDAPRLEQALGRFQTDYEVAYLHMMRAKLGLTKERDEDLTLINQLEDNFALAEVDMTIFFRLLSQITLDDNEDQAFDKLASSFYDWDALTPQTRDHWSFWFRLYLQRLRLEGLDFDAKVKAMHLVNPKYVLRNYMAQLAIDKATEGDSTLIDELYQLLKRPYAEQEDQTKWFAKRPEWARHKVGCSMLSCSS